MKASFESNYRVARQWAPKVPVPTESQGDNGIVTTSNSTEKPNGLDADDAGIRQIRMGTFEDSGKCKGWAFIDFYTIPQATAALLNGRNHTLQNRTLVVEYAGADAIRRGGNRSAATKRDHNPIPARELPSFSQKMEEQYVVESVPAQEVELEPTKAPRRDRGDRQAGKGARGGPTRKLKPGDALAKAPRARMGVVKSEGKKIVFD